MKTKTVYYIIAKTGGYNSHDCSQYLLPNELHLIKTMLNEGIEITGVRKDQLTIEQYKVLFG